MIGKKINKKIITEEEEDNDLIINNDDDDFYYNDQKLSQKKNLEIKVDYNPPKDSEFLASQKAENTNESKTNERTMNRKIFTPVPNPQNINVNSKEAIGEEKTIFSKITEDLYLDNKMYLKPKKIYFDIDKVKEDNYNKLTIENYLFTCADKENSKNNKIISNFLERKTKEQNNKKIGSDPEKDDIENFKEIKGLYSDRKKEKNGNYRGRSPEQFLKEQKILEEKQKNNLDKLIKKVNEEERNFIKDRPTISKQSEKIANMRKIGNKDIHLKLYEEYNIKKQKLEEKNKNYYLFNENFHSTKNKKLNNDEIIKNAERLHQDYEKRKNNYNEIKTKKLNEIKNMSAISLLGKNSNVIINKKLINKYKNEIKSLFNKNISDKFDLSYSDYLLFIYNLGLLEKDYTSEKNEGKNLNISTNNIMIKNFNTKINNIETEHYNNNIKNKIIFSQNVLKRNTHFKSKSSENKKFDEESENKTIKNSWKIITKNKIFSKDEKGNSRRILYFLLSVYGIYKGNLNDVFIKRELPFLSQNEDKSYYIKESMTKQIYKYFYKLRNTAVNNFFLKNKEKEEEKGYNIKDKKKSKMQNVSVFPLKTLDNNQKNNIEKNNKIFVTSKSTKGIGFYQNFKNGLNKNKSINDNHMEKKEKIKYEMKVNNNMKNNINNNENENILNNNAQHHSNILTNNSKQNKVLFINNKINSNKGNNSNSTKNINYKLNKNIIPDPNFNINKNIKINNNKHSKKIIHQKITKNNNFFTPSTKRQIENQNNISIPSLIKGKKNLTNQIISNKELENKLIQNLNKKQENKEKEKELENKSKKEAFKHEKEKNSSISNYIFKEDYRIKEDIESNSNLNNLEETENNENRKINSQNFSQTEFNIEKNEELEKNVNNKEENKSIDENNKLEKSKEDIDDKKSKSKFIFKIKVKKKMIKLIISKGDDIDSKINAFCKENDLNEDDKEEIIEAIKNNLKA